MGSCAMKKTLYRIHPGISGDAVQSFFAIGRQEILPDFAVAKNFFNGECRVVVIPKYDNGNQCELHLVVEKKQLDKQQMEEYLYSRLPYYMIPKHMHCLEQFPLNTSSKTDRKKIQELI